MHIVTVVCGASGVGKSSVARPLAIRLGVPFAEADDLVTALTALTTPASHPVLHEWDERWTPERMVGQTLAVAAALAPGFRAVVDDHISFRAPIVLDGDYLTPDLVAGLGDLARAVLISEPDEDAIVANLLAREPHRGEQRQRAHVSARLDAALVTRATAAGVPVVRSRPFATALDRVLAVL